VTWSLLSITNILATFLGKRVNDTITAPFWKSVSTMFGSSATTLVCIRNTRVFRAALTAPTEHGTLWRKITRYLSPRRRVALHTYLLYCVVMYTHRQNDTCVTLFAVAAVMLKPFAQRLSMLNGWWCLCLSPAAATLGMLLVHLEIIATTYHSTIFKTYAFSLYSHLCIYVSI